MSIELQRVKSLLSVVNQVNISSDNENIVPSINTKLLLIAGLTRRLVYKYATMTSNGAVHIHALIPMKFNDPTERNLRYKHKTSWVSIVLDPSEHKDKETGEVTYYNSNYGLLKHFLNPNIKVGDKVYPNPYNSLTLYDAKLRQNLIPSQVDEFTDEDLAKINRPVVELQALISQNKQVAGDDIEALKTLNTQAYKDYLGKTFELYQKGYLSLSTVFITPKQNSIDIGLSLDETSQAMSNPWMNARQLMTNPEVPLSSIPSHSTFSGLVQIIEGGDANTLLTDNIDMIGERIINSNASENKDVKQLMAKSVVGVIKDFGQNVEILVSLVDSFQTRGKDGETRGRVEVFKSLLESGNNLFNIRGTIRPVVRLKGQQAGRNGNSFYELIIDSYSVHKSTSLSNSIEVDAFADLGGFDVETIDFVAETDTSEVLVSEEINVGASSDEMI